jgi:hypothetical protein
MRTLLSGVTLHKGFGIHQVLQSSIGVGVAWPLAPAALQMAADLEHGEIADHTPHQHGEKESSDDEALQSDEPPCQGCEHDVHARRPKTLTGI